MSNKSSRHGENWTEQEMDQEGKTLFGTGDETTLQRQHSPETKKQFAAEGLG